MDTITLGMTGLDVSRICFGTWQFGGDWGDFDEQEATAAIRHALELGVDIFDTAQGYGWGASERLLGRALADELRTRREDVFLATKGGLRMDGDRLRRDSSPEWLRQGVEQSLEALGVDYIDIYQVHWPDPDTPLAETAGALQEMVDEGKIRHVGVSNFDVEQMREFAKTRPVETLQPPYHLFRRDIEQDILPYCREQNIGVLVYGPLAHGLLGGHMTEETTFPENDWRAHSDLFAGETFRRNLAVVRELDAFARERGYKVSQLAVAWVLAQPGVHVAIVGSRRPAHIEDGVGAADIRLTPEDLEEIDRIMAGAVRVGGPSPEAV
jgi:aryl-alcohol dehydrogenase-like predicted oxidoreductase